jgi:cytochrome c peroxidase
MQRLLVLAALMALPLPALAQTADAQLVEKGRALFNDPKLSGSGQLSCAACHPMNGHTDNKTYVVAEVVADGDPKGRSTPTCGARASVRPNGRGPATSRRSRPTSGASSSTA